MVEIIGLGKTFGKNEVLKGVNIDFDEPGIFSVLGPNGSGKTTLLKCILGMVIPDSGNIFFNKENIRGKWTYRKDISYLPQIARFPENLTVKELIAMVKDIRGNNVSETGLIEEFNLQAYLNSTLKHLSGGTRQKVNILLAFMFDSSVIILDEPTAGLDPLSLIKFKELILRERSKGKIIIITTHIINLVEEVSDKVIFLLEGKIYFNGTPQGLSDSRETGSLENAIANILEENGSV